MINKISLFLSTLVLVILTSCSSEIRFVAWNMEHLAENVGEGCVPRQESDYTELRNFARTLDADVFALQEVESLKAVAKVFPEKDWNIIVSDRPASSSYNCYGNGQKSTQQRVALVIKKGVNFENLGTFKELALDREGLRYGLIANIINQKDTIEVMSVHLKSGCFVQDYSSSSRRACGTFQKQVPLLDTWIEKKIKSDRPFILLGDFNHRIANPDNKLWQVMTEMENKAVVISNSMQDLKGCHPSYPEPIDHILMGAGAEKLQIRGSETVYYFSEKPESMTEEDMLSDHCPIGVELKF